MIATPDDQKAQTEQVQAGPDEPPPLYSAQTNESGSSSNPSAPPAFKTKPTNFLLLSTEYTPIRGEFVIDPSIRIPSSLLSPLGDNESEDDRKNLSLTSKYECVETEMWLLPPCPSSSESATSKQKLLRTTIALTSDHGSIRARLRTLEGAAPFFLTARSKHGMVRLALPRSFHGLISLSACHGSITLSDTLTQNATQLSQLGNTRRYFVGDFQALSEDVWEGDQVEIEAPDGWIQVKYADEEAAAKGKKGLLGWLLGT